MDTRTAFIAWLRASNSSTSTIHYRLAHLTDFKRHHPSFPDVTPAEITNWLGRVGYQPWSRVTYYSHLRSYYRWASEAGVVTADPMVRMHRPRAPKGVPRPLTDAQVDQLFASTTNENLLAWMTLALYSGLRAHEVAKFRGQDIGPDRLFVCGKGGRNAWLPTHPRIWELAQTRPSFGFWFPTGSDTGHVSARSVSALSARLFAANGIEGGLHRMRHTYGTRLLRAGVNLRVVQVLMRHENLASTEVYLQVDDSECRDAIALLAA